MKHLYVIIPTRDRPQMLRRLAEQVRHEANGFALTLAVYDDGSVPPVPVMPGVEHYRFDTPHGKEGYWALVHAAFGEAGRRRFDYLVMLADDLELKPGFFRRAVETYEAIDDPAKIALNLLCDERVGTMQWVPQYPHRRRFADPTDGSISVEVWLQWWTDGCFLAPPRFLRVLGGMAKVMETRWRENPRQSSGVWRQVSRRLYFADLHIYSTCESLVTHGNHPSQMHPAPEGGVAKRPIAI